MQGIRRFQIGSRTRVARTMPIRTGARGLELDEGCPTFRRRFLQSLGDRTRVARVGSCHVTLTRGAAALAVVTNTRKVPIFDKRA